MIAKAMIGTTAVLALSVTLVQGDCEVLRAQVSSSASSLTLLAPEDIKWEPTARPDSKRANLWGDSSKGPFAYFSRYDGGWALPLHFHTNDLRGLILSGTLIIQVTGQPAKELPSGSYFSVPGKTCTPMRANLVLHAWCILQGMHRWIASTSTRRRLHGSTSSCDSRGGPLILDRAGLSSFRADWAESAFVTRGPANSVCSRRRRAAKHQPTRSIRARLRG